MTISGYDPEDVDNALERRLDERDLEEFLTDEEIDQWQSGESLVDLLDESDIERLLETPPTEETD